MMVSPPTEIGRMTTRPSASTSRCTWLSAKV